MPNPSSAARSNMPKATAKGIALRPIKQRHHRLFDNHWKSEYAFRNNELDINTKRWILDTGSLTTRLIAHCEQSFHVEVQQQGWYKPHAHEAKALGLGFNQYALIRETLLMCDNVPWVFARSVIPINSLQGQLRHLIKLNNQSLGALLFKDPFLIRNSFELAHSPAQAFSLPRKVHCPDNAKIWGRRSVFSLYQQPLLVAEVFLPEFAAK